jgi:thiamine-monophosphate kinase
VALGPGHEFDVIRRFLADLGEPPDSVEVGPGDDATVLEGGWVVSTDLSVENVHFRRAWITDREAGGRATAAALSDLAAMAARPVGVLVSMAVQPLDDVDADAVLAGVREAAGAVGASVLGGDVSASPGPLVLDVVVLGRTDAPVLRTGAVPGDEVWVTGVLGASAAAVLLWVRGDEPPMTLRQAFACPVPRVEAARGLAEAGALHALVDLSDGLAGDAGHLAAAGGVRIVLEEQRIPVAEAARAALGDEAALETALRGGEDYELCFVAPPGLVDASALGARLGLPLTRVGRVEEGEGVWLQGADGSVRPAGRGGFDHFGGDGPGGEAERASR